MQDLDRTKIALDDTKTAKSTLQQNQASRNFHFSFPMTYFSKAAKAIVRVTMVSKCDMVTTFFPVHSFKFLQDDSPCLISFHTYFKAELENAKLS